MRHLLGPQVLVRVYTGENAQWHHRPLVTALVERLRKEGFAGVTVFRGIEGYGAHHVIHTTHILELSSDLPLVIEIVETEEALTRLLPILDEMVLKGLVTMSKVEVLKYAPGPGA
ncbi:MAG: hypothetical protein CVV27_09660 [Candidatus Melainabacteria bacterium HGW-Melainabacteria-1]|nr:MAG: hypothetical protein CVV27_09660 [Candidatus Melainabacteria bacterium HGW-Melainabacteria-1]